MAQPARRHSSAILLRFTDEQLLRVQIAAKGKGKTVSDFLRDAAMVYVNSIEEAERVRKQDVFEEAERKFVPRTHPAGAHVPRGSASEFSFLPKREENSSPPPPPSTPPPASTIVIQPVAPSAGRDEIDVLADYVLASKNTVDRMERERVATNVLLSSSKDVDEQRRLAKLLDDKLAAKTHQPEAKTGWGFLRGGARK